ncbi:wall associated protein [Pseudoxanthomonas sangjuensis]|nr:wall associated protein [Pseudoxanthomonas sangjuensis]
MPYAGWLGYMSQLERGMKPKSVERGYMRNMGWMLLLTAWAGSLFGTDVLAQSSGDSQAEAGSLSEPPTDQVSPMAVGVGGGSDPQTALMTVVEPKLEVSLSPLDDSYDPATGTVTFSATDISLPGNFAIPVELSRWVPSDDSDTGGPGTWKWNIPFIRGNYLDVKDGHSDTGWDWGYNTWRHGKNCSGSADSVVNNNGDLIAAEAYWNGKLLHIPGVTSETFLVATGGQQVTKSNFKITGCINNASGQEGIVVAGPDGLTYTFNQIKSYYNNKAALKDPIVRTRLLMVTKIEDRFGNHVDYSYTDGKLIQISASDGRVITIAYNASGATASANGRTWTYADDVVTLPDGVGQWKYEGLPAVAFKPNGIGSYSQQFRIATGEPNLIPGCSVATGDYTVKVTSPGGLLTTYLFRDTIHYRANVEPYLYYDVYAQGYVISRSVNCTIARSLVSRSISGPGITAATWNYQYSGNRGTYTASSGLNDFLTGPFDLPVPAVGGYPSPITAGNAVNYRSTTVSGPDKKIVFYIDRQSDTISENRTIAQDVLNAAGNQLLQRTEYTFALGNLVGQHGLDQPVNGYQLMYRINQTQITDKYYVSGGTDTYVTTSSNYDAYGYPLSSQESNSFSSNVRTVEKTYLHDTTNGLIGLPLTEKVNGITAVENRYNALGQRDWTKAFGKLQQTLTYDVSSSVASGQRGTLKTVKDGNNNVTTYTNWKRGIPQTAAFADGKTKSVTVDGNGWIVSITDENGAGYTTNYGYDAMGRLASTAYPTGDTTAWNTTTQVFEKVASSEYGIAAGHWRQTISTGNGKKISYFDALWRPLVVREYDAANVAGTQRFQRFTYDHEGRVTFAAYPGTTDALSTGTWTEYDALGRVTSVSQDSEQGLLISTTAYLAGLKIRATAPNGSQTTTTFKAYGQPTTDWPVLVAHPEGAYTHITRDAFGKPTRIRRSNSSSPTGGTVAINRDYAYNANQELCRAVEPETGATLMGYDGAGNLKWSAAGLGSTQACETAGTSTNVAPRRVDRTYDARNRLKTLVFPDGKGNQTWTYTADGLPKTIATYNGANNTQQVNNTYNYNKRRLLTSEVVAQPNWYTWTATYSYNANGHLSSQSYPGGGLSVSYAPNALGQPTQVGTYASGVSYYPNGAIKQFTYGNGIVHTMTQNARQLPSRSTDCTTTGTCSTANKRLDLSYSFDKNANVAQIVDNLDGRQTRGMSYDGLDRLIQTTSNMFGTASYSYDVLDNITRATVGTSPTLAARDWYYCYTGNRLSNVKTGSCAGATVVGLEYDVQGNVVNKSGQVYNFDYGNRLRSATGEAYRYDGYGRRVLSNASAGNIVSMYGQSGQLLYTSNNRTVKRTEYIYLGGSLVAQRERPTSSETATVKYQHTDALGSPIATTDANKAFIDKTEYEPYGRQSNRPVVDGPGYTGHVQDAATGLTYMQQRYMDPALGVFLSVDPVTAYDNPIGAFNRYWYASNNPYKFTDPDGRAARITRDGGTILVELPTKFTGDGASAENIAAVTSGFESQSGVYTVDGVPTQVDFKVTQITKDTPKSLQNEVRLVNGPTDNPTGSGVSYADKVGGTKATVDVTDRGFQYGSGHHEMDHLAGAEDGYTRDASGKKVPDPNRPGDIMARLPGKMTDRAVGEIVKHPNNEQVAK